MKGRYLLAAGALVVAAALLPAPAASISEDPRAELLETFQLMSRDYEHIARAYAQQHHVRHGPAVFGNPNVFVQIPPARDTPAGKLHSMVKVAARKYDAVRKIAGDYVSLTGYEWQRNEYFVLCFQSASPVTFSLFNMAGGPDGAPIPQYPAVLPSPRMPESREPIEPGKVYEFTNPLWTEDKGEDEVIEFVFVEAWNPRLRNKKISVFDKTMGDIAAELRKNRARYEGLNLAPPPKVVSRNFDDVAVVAGATNTSGVLQLILLKKKP